MSAPSLAQVDPAWLKSWQISVANRPATLSSNAQMTTANEPGATFIINGQVFNPDGQTPAAGVLVLAYHRDQAGFDFGKGDKRTNSWRIQAWVKTDEQGRFKLTSIRPGTDHLGREAAHIHFTIESEKYGRQWLPTVYLADDPIITPKLINQSKQYGRFANVLEVNKHQQSQQLKLNLRLKAEPDF
ncbi:dioxygenase family protein [Paraglaciecola aestuariivivens]